MWQIASQMFLCLVLAGLIGVVAGWAVASLMGQDRTARLEEATARVTTVEHELALAARRATLAEAARERIAGDLDGALARVQDVELRQRSAEDRTMAAEAGVRTATERAVSAEEALRAVLSRLSVAESAARESGEAREQAESRFKEEAVRAAHAEEAIRMLEGRPAEELEQLRADRDRVQVSLREALERLQGLQTELTNSRERMEALLDTEAGERAMREQRLRQAMDRVAHLEASHRALETLRDGAEARVRSMEDALRDRDAERDDFESRLQAVEAQFYAEQEAHQRTQMRVMELTRQPRVEKARRERRDDLKEIIGVGPVLERLLHRHGVHTFRQVALWTRQDIRRVDAALDEFHGRIRRDHWVQQARTLHRRRHGESLTRRTVQPGNGHPMQSSP
jgi:predicted flap endonuclease-1-like 5' DNA nuclease